MAFSMAKKGKASKGLKASLRRFEEAEKLKKKREHQLASQKKFEAQKKKSISGGGKAQSNQKGFVPFNTENTVLLVGEGDFSFAVSVVKNNHVLPTNLVATSYDRREIATEKYTTAANNLEYLESRGVKVLFEIDATKLPQTLGLSSKKNKLTLFSASQKLDVILFNFPHTGKGIKDMDRNVRDHQKLVLQYFQNCNELFPIVNERSLDAAFSGYSKANDERIILSTFEGEPYVFWGIKAIARSEDWKVQRSGRFDWDLFPEYHHRRTNSMKDTTKEASVRDARIYVFERRLEEPLDKTQ